MWGHFRALTPSLRFFALRMRCGEARGADSCRMLCCASRTRRVNAAANETLCKFDQVYDRRHGKRRGNRRVFACNDPSLQAPPLRSFTIRSRSCTVASFFCAVFRYRVEPSRPGQASGPFLLCNLLAWRRSWGSLRCPSQACSRIGCEIISDHAGPRACSTRPSAPIDFRRVIPSSFDASMQTREPRNLRKIELGFWA